MSSRGGLTAAAASHFRPDKLIQKHPPPPAAPRERTQSVSTTNVWDRIEQARAEHDVLQHPFYLRWSAGELSSEELARYSGQYRHATEALAKLCADTAELAPEARRDELQLHASEEQDHIAMWDGFVESVGGEIGAEPTAETSECVREWTAPRGYLGGLARLYAIESGQPAISKTKREGLGEHYGVGDGDGNEYFRVHEASDEAHADESRRLIEEALRAPGREADEDAVVEAAESAFRANWRLLDGVS